MGPTPISRATGKRYLFITARYINGFTTSEVFTPVVLKAASGVRLEFFILEYYALTQAKDSCAYKLVMRNRQQRNNYELCLSYQYKNFYYTIYLPQNGEVEISLVKNSSSKLLDLKLWVMMNSELCSLFDSSLN